MERLTQREFRALSRFLREIYTLGNFDAYVERLLRGLHDVFPCELATYNEMDVKKAKSDNWTDPNEINEPKRAQIWLEVMHEHPVLMHHERTERADALKISDFCSVRQYRRLALYNEFYRPMGIEDALVAFLDPDDSRRIGLAVHRGKRTFKERERLLLNLIRPHLAQARANAKRFELIQRQVKNMNDAIDTLPMGIALLDQDGKICFLTRKADQLLTKYWGDKRKDGGWLPDDLRYWAHQQDKEVGAGEVPLPRYPFKLERPERKLEVRFLASTEQKILMLDEIPARQHQPVVNDSSISKREGQVLTWLAQGKSNREIGTILRISKRTVQKHVEHILDKLGVENRTAAALFAVERQRSQAAAATKMR